MKNKETHARLIKINETAHAHGSAHSHLNKQVAFN